MEAAARYTEALQSIPAPGGGCHPFLLSIANLGVMAGIAPDRIHSDIANSIPHGRRRVSDREILDTIKKALSDYRGGTFTAKPRPQAVVNNGKKALHRIIESSTIRHSIDLSELSPIRLWDKPEKDATLLLSVLFREDDLIWIGDRRDGGTLGDTIRPVREWIAHSEKGGATAEHIIINPLTGHPALTKAGDKETLRGDACVKSFRFCLVEFDTLSREDQIRFWSAVRLPIVALIDSGGKSIHGWIDVQKLAKVEALTEWDTEIKTRLYDRILKPMGVDGACSNPARLSRLPGHFRTEKNALQKLLYLSTEGRPLNA